MEELYHSNQEITSLLQRYKSGDKQVYDKLFKAVYHQLKKVAHNIRFHHIDYQTLNTTALVHEAYLKLLGSNASMNWENRRHFFSLAAKVIRQILIDSARKKLAQKRSSEEVQTDEGFMEMPENTAYDVEALEKALKKLEKRFSTVSKVIEYRFYTGLTIKETAEMLDLSPATVKRNWTMGKLWLYNEIKRYDGLGV
ncbi:MAG: ECF-type sigma factor [Bacteroidota bacterium]